jgi:deoxyribonuclease V
MKTVIAQEWLYPETLEEAAKVQRLLADRVVTQDDFDNDAVSYIGGVDISCNWRDPENYVYAAMVTLDTERLTVVDSAGEVEQTKFPYVPGFLGFRETPALVKAFYKLKTPPDLVMVDGHGISHPRGLGIASHLGVVLDIPTIGVAKSVLVGKPQGLLGNQPGDWVPIIYQGREIGCVLRTKPNVNPLYISIGHRISLPTALHWVLHCLKGYRLPETTRMAHNKANEYRKAALQV